MVRRQEIAEIFHGFNYYHDLPRYQSALMRLFSLKSLIYVCRATGMARAASFIMGWRDDNVGRCHFMSSYLERGALAECTSCRLSSIYMKSGSIREPMPNDAIHGGSMFDR